MQQAYAQANEVVTMASQQAQEILDKATIEANELRAYAAQYTEDRLAELESVILSAIQSSNANYGNLIGSLNQYKELIQSNRQALHPAEDFEEIPLDDAADESGIDVIQ